MWATALAVVTCALAVSVCARGSSCSEVRTRCAYRSGCGAALNNYMELCADVLADPMDHCPEPCQHALIALTSTEEGKDLMTCDCENEYYCINAKERIDVCRPHVVRGAANATASCRLSQLICAADAQCATALDYYHRLCRAMYRGRKCSHKCLNSIEILRKQRKAAALTACRCDGHEDYDCPRMQSNLARLCFRKHKKTRNDTDEVFKRTRSEAHKPKTDAAGARHVSCVLVSLCFLWFFIA